MSPGPFGQPGGDRMAEVLATVRQPGQHAARRLWWATSCTPSTQSPARTYTLTRALWIYLKEFVIIPAYATHGLTDPWPRAKIKICDTSHQGRSGALSAKYVPAVDGDFGGGVD
jgi:hypothetical protein